MQKTMGAGAQPGSAGRNETHRTVVSNLESVIDQVRKSLRLIESEIASGTTPEEVVADDVIVLDDVTPGYARAYGVLRECDAGLSVALRLLGESMTPGERVREFYEGSVATAHLPISA
jgi:hypothetical protein